jgi:hypothetical protein
MLEAKRSATNLHKLALGCMALLLVLFGGLSQRGSESGRTIAVQVLRQAIGLRAQSAQLQILASEPAGEDDVTSPTTRFPSMGLGWLHEYVVSLEAPSRELESRPTASEGLGKSLATLRRQRARAPPRIVV